jgi:hypothetical protein
MTTWLSRLWHHLRGHRVVVRWAISVTGNSGWRYYCSCNREWAW